MMDNRTAVIHVALNPCTGPWSVMRELALAQAESGLYAGVEIGVLHDRRWPSRYADEAARLGISLLKKEVPRAFGTAQFLLQMLFPPGIERWVMDVARRAEASNVVIHFHNAWLSGALVPLKSIAGLKTRCVATFHGVPEDFSGKPVRHALHRWMARRLLRSNVRLTSVDPFGAQMAERLFGCTATGFANVPNGMPATKTRGCPYCRGAERFTVGHVGGIGAGKGWHIAAAAVVQLADAGKPVRLVIAGDGEEKSEAEVCARAHPGVVDYRGHVDNPRETLGAELDLLAVMSDREGLPMTIVESLSIGVPVAATAVGGIPGAVIPGRNGFLVDRTPQALAEVVDRLLGDRDELSRLSDGALRHFEQNFDITRVVAAYREVYGLALHSCRSEGTLDRSKETMDGEQE